MEEAECMKVLVRCRPMLHEEVEQGFQPIIEAIPNKPEVIVHRQTEAALVFPTDYILDTSISQKRLFERACVPYLNKVMAGYNCNIMAYGQQKSGKDYTIFGNQMEAHEGIATRSIEYLINFIKSNPKIAIGVLKIEMMQIYKEVVFDVFSETLSRSAIQIRENSIGEISTKGLIAHYAVQVEQAKEFLKNAYKRMRVINQIKGIQYAWSSVIVSISLQIQEEGREREDVRISKLNIVKLASTPQTEMKDASLAHSMTYFQNLIKLLSSKNRKEQFNRVPFPYRRNIKLTSILAESFIGKTNTLFIANICPTNKDQKLTIDTLEFCSCARKLWVKPSIKIVKDSSSTILKLQRDAQELKLMLFGTLSMEKIVLAELKAEEIKQLQKGYTEDDWKIKEKAKGQSSLIVEQQKRDDQICQRKQEATLKKMADLFIISRPL